MLKKLGKYIKRQGYRKYISRAVINSQSHISNLRCEVWQIDHCESKIDINLSNIYSTLTRFSKKKNHIEEIEEPF
jgi:hypothetical protein